MTCVSYKCRNRIQEIRRDVKYNMTFVRSRPVGRVAAGVGWSARVVSGAG